MGYPQLSPANIPLRQRWLKPLAAAALHLASFFLAAWLAALIVACDWPRASLPVPGWAWAVVGVVAAGLYLPALEPAFSRPAGRRAASWPSLATSLSVVLIVAILLSLDASISSLTLLIYFGLALAGDSLRHAWPVLQPPTQAGPDAHMNPASAAPWAFALFFLFVAMLNFAAGREPNAERLANWAYGFLVLGMSAALLRRVPAPASLRRRALRWAPLGLGLLLVVTGFLLERIDQPPLVLRGDTAVSVLRPAYAALAAYLGRNAQLDDAVLTQDLTVGLGCYGLRRVQPAQLNSLGDVDSQIASAMAGRRRLFFVYSTVTEVSHRREQLALELSGDLIQKVPGVLALEVYAVHPETSLTSSAVSDADFGAITLRSAAYQSSVRSGGALGVSLRLSLNEQTDRDYVAKLVLLDGSGQTVADLEDVLLNQAGQRTADWAEAGLAQDSLLLPVPLGTPPAAYQLALGFYDSTDLTGLAVRNWPALAANRLLPLGIVQVIRPTDFSSDSYETISKFRLTAGLQAWPDVRLLAYRPISGTITSGDSLPLLLQWEALQDHPASRPLLLRLLTGTQNVASQSAILGGEYPLDQWQLGEQVLQRVSLPTRPEAAPGPARVQISLDGDDWLDVGAVNIRPIQRTLDAPAPVHPLEAAFGAVAQLAGYDFALPGAPDGPIGITLYWKALNPAPLAVRYKVFVHVMGPDGQILAQSDAEPSNWSRPTTSWIAGEFISDTHSLLLPAGYAGRVTFRIGLYDSSTLERVPVRSGDFIILPDELIIPGH